MTRVRWEQQGKTQEDREGGTPIAQDFKCSKLILAHNYKAIPPFPTFDLK